ncbi:hypothetical protein HPB48_010441 [Haemaphysalis longicornis]|uniref:Uncharacterized protein n=1 Tax=Haemaphysalis longicornis TaxID=44386 RepID=A0A9J6FRU3_HAELO|nr:hypothetical protein HPB48_010441 [Haemaphysalis longicornis]
MALTMLLAAWKPRPLYFMAGEPLAARSSPVSGLVSPPSFLGDHPHCQSPAWPGTKSWRFERAKTRELERLLRLAETEYRARPGNNDVVRPCCSCGQITHSSADCRRYRYLDRERDPSPQREQWVEVVVPEPGERERPRVVTAAVSGISKKRQRKVGGGLVGPRVTAMPFKLSLDTVKAFAVLRKVITPDQLNRSAKPDSLAEASHEGVTADPAIRPAPKPMAVGTGAIQLGAAESALQVRGTTGTLVSTARTVEGVVCFLGKADEPGKWKASPLSVTATGVEAGGQIANAYLGSTKALPYRDQAGQNLLLVEDAPADICGGGNTAGTAAEGRGLTQRGAAFAGDMDSYRTEPLSAQADTRPQQCPPGLTCVDNSPKGSDNGSNVALDGLLGPSKFGCSAEAPNGENPLLAGAANQQGSQGRKRGLAKMWRRTIWLALEGTWSTADRKREPA